MGSDRPGLASRTGAQSRGTRCRRADATAARRGGPAVGRAAGRVAEWGSPPCRAALEAGRRRGVGRRGGGEGGRGGAGEKCESRISGRACDLGVFLWQGDVTGSLDVRGDVSLLSRYFGLVPPV